MDMKETEQKMHSGELYHCGDEELIATQMRAKEMLYDFNQTRPFEEEKRRELLRKMFAEFGANSYIEQPLNANWGGRYVHFGKDVYANSGLTMVDDTHIYVGDNVMLGPNVTLCTGSHPISPRLRRAQVQYNLPIHIENNVWIGGGVFVMPGVTIGENSVIGANSVVTKDIPANVVAAGIPCRVLREISDQDEQYYYKEREIDL